MSGRRLPDMSKSQNAPLAVPDTLGSAGRAALGAEALLGLHQQRQRLTDAQIINGHEEDSPLAPNEVVTYREKFAQIDAAVGRLVAAYEDVDEEFRAAVEAQRKQIFG